MAVYAQIAQKSWTAKREDGTSRDIQITIEELNGVPADLEIPLVQDIQIKAGDRSDETNKPIKVHQLSLQLKKTAQAGDILSKLNGAAYRQLRVTVTDVTNNYELFKGYVIGDQSEFGLYEKVQSLQVKATGQLADLSATDALDASRTLAEYASDVAASLDITRDLAVYSSLQHSGKLLTDPLPAQLRANQKLAAGDGEKANLFKSLQGMLIALGWQAFQENGRLVFADVWERFNSPAAVGRYESDGMGSYTRSTENHLVQLTKAEILRRGKFRDLPPVLDFSHSHIFSTRDDFQFPDSVNVIDSGTVNQSQGLLRTGDVVNVRHFGEADLELTPGSNISGSFKYGQVKLIGDHGTLYYDFDAEEWVSEEKWAETLFFFLDPDSPAGGGDTTKSVAFALNSTAYKKLTPVPEGIFGTLQVEMLNQLTITEGAASLTSTLHEALSAFIEFNEEQESFRRVWEATGPVPVGKNQLSNVYVGDEDAYTSKQAFQYLSGGIWENTTAWVDGAGTSELGALIRDRIGKLLVGQKKQYEFEIRDLQRISLLSIIELPDNDGIIIKALPVEITHHVLRGFYSIRVVGNFGDISSTDDFYSFDPAEEVGTTSGSGSSGGGSSKPSSPSDHGLLTGLNDPADHPWAMEKDFSNVDDWTIPDARFATKEEGLERDTDILENWISIDGLWKDKVSKGQTLQLLGGDGIFVDDETEQLLTDNISWALSLKYNAVNLKIDGDGSLNTIQDIHSGADVDFNSLALATQFDLGDIRITNGIMEALTGNLTLRALGGDIIIDGQTIQADHEITTADTIIKLNDNEPGDGVTAGFSGIQIYRGGDPLFPDYLIGFREADDQLVLGEFMDAGGGIPDPAGLQALLTRQNIPIDGGVFYYNESEMRGDTLAGFVFDGLNLLLPNQATAATHALQAGRSVTLSDDADGILSWAQNAYDLTDDRSWVPSIADHAAGQRGVLNVNTQGIYGAKTFHSDAFFAAGVASPGAISRVSGWQGNELGVFDFRSVFSDTIIAKAFTADVSQLFRGSRWLSKSFAVIDQNFVIPAVSGVAGLTVREVDGFPGLNVFETGDFLLLPLMNQSGGGLIIGEAWGEITSVITDNGNGTQSFDLTIRHLSAPELVGQSANAGSEAISLGTAADPRGFVQETVLDELGSPYYQIVTWATNPWTRANWTVQVRMGNLAGFSFNEVNLSGFGAYYKDNFYVELSGGLAYFGKGADGAGDDGLFFDEDNYWLTDRGFKIQIDGSDLESAVQEIRSDLIEMYLQAHGAYSGIQFLAGQVIIKTDENGKLAVVRLDSTGEESVISIAADQVNIDGTTTFSSGYDPSTKETPIGAQEKVNSLQTDLDLILDNAVMNGTTIIDGGFVKTILLNPQEIIFTDPDDTQVIGSINGSNEGIAITGDRIDITANTEFQAIVLQANGADASILEMQTDLINLYLETLGAYSGIQFLAGQVIIKTDENGKLAVVRLDSTGEESVISIAADQIHIDGTTTFSSGYDPSTKETPIGAQEKVNSLQTDLDLILDNAVANGTTLIAGGLIVADFLLVDTAQIVDAAITNAKIGDAEIDSAKISSLDAEKINAASLEAISSVIGGLNIDSSRIYKDGDGLSMMEFVASNRPAVHFVAENGEELWIGGDFSFDNEDDIDIDRVDFTPDLPFSDLVNASVLSGTTPASDSEEYPWSAHTYNIDIAWIGRLFRFMADWEVKAEPIAATSQDQGIVYGNTEGTFQCEVNFYNSSNVLLLQKSTSKTVTSGGTVIGSTESGTFGVTEVIPAGTSYVQVRQRLYASASRYQYTNLSGETRYVGGDASAAFTNLPPFKILGVQEFISPLGASWVNEASLNTQPERIQLKRDTGEVLGHRITIEGAGGEQAYFVIESSKVRLKNGSDNSLIAEWNL